MDNLFKRSEATFLQRAIFDFFILITYMDAATFQKEASKFEIFDHLDHNNKYLLYASGTALARTLAHVSIATQIQQKHEKENYQIPKQKYFDISAEREVTIHCLNRHFSS